MLLAKNTQQSVVGNLPSIARFTAAIISATFFVGIIAIFSVFALMLIFSYFNDVVYEVIFFFVILSIGVNIAVRSIISSTIVFYGE